MLTLNLPPGPLKILCLGAHADDIEIGCGGTLLRLLAEHQGSACRWIVFSATAEREREARDSAIELLAGAGDRMVDIHRFRDGRFPPALGEIKDALEAVRGVFAPTLIFAHWREDRHQDHRTISDVAWQTFREHLILEYEIPKWDGDLGHPNCYVPLTREIAHRKSARLLTAFPSQRTKAWFTEDVFLAMLRLRGVECTAADGYAEAFHARKILLGSR